MAPAAERVVLVNEFPFTELSQPFAKRLMDYAKGSAAECLERAKELAAMVEFEEGLKCPQCGAFAGEFLRDVLTMHSTAIRRSQIDKKHLKIQPERNSTKPVYSYLLVSPQWLSGSPGILENQTLGGFPDADLRATEAWYAIRSADLELIEVRGRIRLSEDSSVFGLQLRGESAQENTGDIDEDEEELAEADDLDRKQFGLPRFITLASGQIIDTRKGTIPKQSHFTCGRCGLKQDFRESIEHFGSVAPHAPYAIQCHCPTCSDEGYIYGGRSFLALSCRDLARLERSDLEWQERRNADLSSCWPREEIEYSYMTHQANFALPRQGYTHWWKLFGSRQLIVLSSLLKAIRTLEGSTEVRLQALGAFQQYLRMQNMFVIWHQTYDKIAPFMSNPNFAPKARVVENNFSGALGYGTWASCAETIVEGLTWCRQPTEPFMPNSEAGAKSSKVLPGDPVREAEKVMCCSSSDLRDVSDGSIDLVITDPPFGDNIFYSDLSNFFYVWLKLYLHEIYPADFIAAKTPNALEALAPRTLPTDEANDHYRARLTACWSESFRVLGDRGILAFTFHHSEDSQWAIVLESLFNSGFLLEQTFPIASDEQKGEGGQYGAKGTEYDIIHVCRKRLTEPAPVSWAKMRQWVRAELGRLKLLLDIYRAREISDADIRVILRGKALEFYSRHYGKVLTAADEPMPLAHALAGINQLLDEGTGDAAALPPSVVQPVAYQYLRLFTTRETRSADDVNKSLFGTALRQKDLAEREWIEERNKTVTAIPIRVRFEHHRKRPRKEMKTEIDQAHFLIGAAMPNSGVNLEDELTKDTWMLRRSVDAVLDWYTRMTPDPSVRNAAMLARTILRNSVERMRERPGALEAQLSLFNDWDETES